MTSQRSLIFAAGLTLGLLVALFFHMLPSQPVQAQAPAVGAVGRFQIAPFVLQQLTPGAYILDTQTGEVFQVVGKNAPEPLGSVTRPQPKK